MGLVGQVRGCGRAVGVTGLQDDLGRDRGGQQAKQQD